jgi:Archaeal PaREP1/PaREP8 family
LTSNVSINKPVIEKYLQNSSEYYDNSQDLIKQKEFAKAGEFLWGAIAEATKALGFIIKNEPIRSHNEITKYLNELQVQEGRGKGRIKKEHTSAAHQLHINFYESSFDEETFLELYDYANFLYGFLMDLVKILLEHHEPANVTSMLSNRDK